MTTDTQVITAIQEKGGTGKTTLICMLASLMAEDGARVAIIDTDPQQTAIDFAKASERAGIEMDYLQEMDEGALVKKVKALAKEGSHDVIFVDTAGLASQITDYAVHASDLVLIPVKPAKPDVRGLVASIRTVENSEAVRNTTIPTYIVMTDVDSRARITASWLDEIKKLNRPLLDAHVLHRTGFREFMSTGDRLHGNARKVANALIGDMQVRGLITYYAENASAVAAE